MSAIGDILCHRHLSLFGHVARLDPGVPEHDDLRMMVDTYEGRKPMASWRRPPGRPHNVWLNKVQEDANALLLSTLWRSEIARGHGATQQFTRLHDDADNDVAVTRAMIEVADRTSRSVKHAQSTST